MLKGIDVFISLGTTYYGRGFSQDGLFVWDIDYSSYDFVSFMATANNIDLFVWHASLGHIRQDRMKRLAKINLLT